VKPKQAAVIVSLLLAITACTPPDEGTVEPDSTSLETSETQAPDPPTPHDFSSEAAQMADWDDTCEVADTRLILEQFADLDSIDYSPAELDPQDNEIQDHSCTAHLNLRSEDSFVTTWLTVEVFNQNIEAFDRYYGRSIRYPYIYSDAEVDLQYDLGEESSWNAVQIFAQDTPTVKSEQRVMATAVMLGDFYTVEILVRFKPDEHERADCESETEGDCIITAAHIAEFLATGSYLEDLHSSIEATFERDTE
jgi:hypothetical protein